MNLEKQLADYMFKEYGAELFRNEHAFAFVTFHPDTEECLIRDFDCAPEGKAPRSALKLFRSICEAAYMKQMKYVTAVVSVGGEREVRGTKLVRGYMALGFKIMDARNAHVCMRFNLETLGE